MSLSPDQVKKIAHLARLNLSETDIAAYTPQLSNILDFVEQLSTVATAHIEPLAHPLYLNQPFREDKVIEPNLRDKYQAIAPQVESGLYLVPKVIEEA
jgi:aspartyl-tRNA(Asn)/glutamyl-tRNA(Gln) amidotransferase subunit C